MPRDRIIEAARVALSLDDEPNMDLVDFLAGYSSRSGVQHHFKTAAELWEMVGEKPNERRLTSVEVASDAFDLSTIVHAAFDGYRVHMDDAATDGKFLVWQKVNGGMRSVELKREVGKVIFVAGLSLYAGEGTKSLEARRVELANSDPGILRVFMALLNELGVPLPMTRARCQIHRTGEATEATRYWKAQLGLSDDQFSRPHISTPGGSTARRTFTLQMRYSNTMLQVLFRNWCERLEFLVGSLRLPK